MELLLIDYAAKYRICSNTLLTIFNASEPYHTRCVGQQCSNVAIRALMLHSTSLVPSMDLLHNPSGEVWSFSC